MEAIPPNNWFNKTLQLSALLIFLSAFITTALGYSVHNIHHENVHLKKFLSMASTVQSDFEQSLIMYTQNTQEAIEFVNTLRPDTEAEFIDFIGTLENLGQIQNLDLNLRTLDGTKETLEFAVDFYGSKKKMVDFIQGIESLPYYIRIKNIHYKDLAYVSNASESLEPNIQLTLALYVKASN